ncbi:hypothetical protein TNCV_1911021 [Trichonephila clavipes]|nr:hypothetical protein TNCV_1911021 [Trichonephila clavipes]
MGKRPAAPELYEDLGEQRKKIRGNKKGTEETQPYIVVGSLVVRASDSRSEGLGSMPGATKYPLSTNGVRAR